MINSVLFFCLLNIFISQNEDEIYKSPCDLVNITNSKNPKDCYGRSTEFIEEICCYLESIVKDKETNELKRKYECIDFAKSDYDRPEQKNIAIEQIKNGTYWTTYNDIYEDIISLKCESNCIYIKVFSFLIFSYLIM